MPNNSKDIEFITKRPKGRIEFSFGTLFVEMEIQNKKHISHLNEAQARELYDTMHGYYNGHPKDRE